MFQPVVGVGGYTGWRVLQTTQERQQEAFGASQSIARETQYFRDNISKAISPEALIGDRQLLKVALGAFGLGEELNKQAFVRRGLEEGTDERTAFVNRLPDQRYRDFVNAFSYGNADGGAQIFTAAFQEDIIARYKTQEFENAVGEVDGDIQLALNFNRKIGAIANGENAENSGWFQVFGQLPLRTVVSTALGLPESVAQLDLDRQREIFEEKTQAVFGEKSVKAFANEENVETAIRRFFLFQQINAGPSASTAGASALTLLQSSSIGGGNLLLSQA